MLDVVIVLILLFFLLKAFEGAAKRNLQQNPQYVHRVVQRLFFMRAIACFGALFFVIQTFQQAYELIAFMLGMSVIVLASGFVVI